MLEWSDEYGKIDGFNLTEMAAWRHGAVSRGNRFTNITSEYSSLYGVIQQMFRVIPIIYIFIWTVSYKKEKEKLLMHYFLTACKYY